MMNAGNGDTINFDTAVFPPGNPQTILLFNCLPQIIQGNLTIDASNAGVILNGSNTPPVSSDGFYITSDGNTIKGMQILNFPDAGIYIYNSASNNIITGNNISNNNVGMDLLFSSDNTITGNNISNNNYGILLYTSSSNTITGNNFYNNGLCVYFSYQNTVTNWKGSGHR